MTLEQLGNLGEFIASVATLLTLVYLAIQIRQNTAQLKLQTANEVLTLGQEGFTPIYFPDMNRIWNVGHDHPDQLDEMETKTFGNLMQRQLANLQNMAYQANAGALEPELLDSYTRILGAFVRTPGGSAWWQANRSDFTDLMRDLIESDV